MTKKLTNPSRFMTLIPCTLTDIIIFGEKKCPSCGETYARCTDFFGKDADSKDGLRHNCRQCVRDRDAKHKRDITKRKKEAAK